MQLNTILNFVAPYKYFVHKKVRWADPRTKTEIFIDTNHAVSMAKGTAAIDGRYFHLSLDDGFRNMFQNAILASGIPVS